MKLMDPLNRLAKEVATELGYEIYALDLKRYRGKQQLVVTIDNEKASISLDDCKKFSERFGRILDEENVIEGSYELVVQSPGVERDLRNPGDYARFTGKLAKLILKSPLDNRTVLVGIIEQASESTVTIREKDTGKIYGVAYENIKRANLKLEF
ncbi:hypothetical protein AT15_07230 [Kosmotoga arenicorallina S304]|uniref:Ribosome maturation factor RimP n=1 Tax=Kosmotoga arenicorallina S304 TaxID=1453497 RepID=A0A182C726_9BACT|nr:ribosome maturation factor RimP [Kosmotoga arenicorallina]OAA31281.1 hypothetical protein AT15_07230 [Kosmotoga arenicorallina S304]